MNQKTVVVDENTLFCLRIVSDHENKFICYEVEYYSVHHIAQSMDELYNVLFYVVCFSKELSEEYCMLTLETMLVRC